MSSFRPKRLGIIVAGLLIGCLATAQTALRAQDSSTILIRAGRVETMAGEALTPGAVLVANGRIVRVGSSIVAGTDTEVIDLGEEGTLIPGLVELDFEGGVTGPDSEQTREVIADFSLVDAIDQTDRRFIEALVDGTTTVAVLPGSENVISGTATVIKSEGQTVLLEDGPLIIAMCNDPVRGNRSRSRPDTIYIRQPTNRMGVVSILRKSFDQAAKSPANSSTASGTSATNPGLIRLQEVLRGDRRLIGLSRTEYDILTLGRIADEFQLKPILMGGQESYKVADVLAEAEIPVILGRLQASDDRGPEGTEIAWNVAGLLDEAGVTIALSGGDLLDQARFAVRFGLDRESALESITIVPARLIGIDRRVGSIQPGKDADLLALTGDPLELTSRVQWTMVGGVIYDPKKHIESSSMSSMQED